jgi:hypothetical protein
LICNIKEYFEKFKLFIEYKNEKNKYLFSDSLLYVYKNDITIPCKILIVDEGQDLTLLQFNIIKKPRKAGLFYLHIYVLLSAKAYANCKSS